MLKRCFKESSSLKQCCTWYEIIAKGVKLFISEEGFKGWLNEPNYALGGEKPKELLKDPYEVEKVDNTIEAMFWGNLM